jgi:hypothetical protein
MSEKMVLADSYYDHPTQRQSDFSDYFWPKIDWSNPMHAMQRLAKCNNLVDELRSLSKAELISLLNAVFNFPQLK